MYNKLINELQALTQHTFYASALYEFDEEGNKGKGRFLADETPLTTSKKFNVAKTYLNAGHPTNTSTREATSTNPNKLLIFDFDDPEFNKEEYYELFPTLLETLTTSSSRAEKHHYYVYYISEELDNIRDTYSLRKDGVDILTTGVIQEGYPSSVIINDDPIAQLSTAEEKLLVGMLRSNMDKARVAKGTFYKNYPALGRIAAFNTHGFPSKRPLQRALLEAILPTSLFESEYKSTKKALALPDINYQVVNDIITKVSYNQAVSVEVRDKFVEALLKEYDIDVESKESQRRLACILPSLPCNEGHVDINFENFEQKLKSAHLNMYNAAAIKYVHGKDMYYSLVDPDTFKIKSMSVEGTQLSKNAMTALVTDEVYHEMGSGVYGEDTNIQNIVKQFVDNIPTVLAINNPSKPFLEYSDTYDMPRYNMAPVSRYVEQATPVDHIPDSLISRLIESVMGEYSEFYYYLLAHMVYNPTPPQTVLMLASPETGTGKTLLSSALPQALIASARNIPVTEIQKGWGDTIVATKCLGFNDLQNLKAKDWDDLYAFVKDVTTGNQRRQLNRKYGGIVTAILPTISVTISSNNYFPIDPDDRRLWVIRPQHIEYDDSGKPATTALNRNDADAVTWMLNHSGEEYHKELQELANYLLHLYETNPGRYNKELTQRAPHTKYREHMINQHATYTSRITRAITMGPEEFDRILDEEYREYIYRVIIAYTKRQKAALPHKFLAEVIHKVKGEPEGGPKYKVASVANALGVSESDIKKRTADYYELDSKIFDNEIEYETAKGYSQTALLIDMPDKVLTEYKNAIGISIQQRVKEAQKFNEEGVDL